MNALPTCGRVDSRARPSRASYAPTRMPRIELLFFPGCPHLEAARAQLRRALARTGLPAEWDEHDVTDAATAPALRGYGSPSILIDGVDVVGAPPGEGVACRLYSGSEVPGAPPLEALLRALSPTTETPSR